MSIQTHIFDRTPQQMDELKALAESWEEHFWSIPLTLDAVRRPGSLVVFATEEEESRWLGVALCDVGAYEAELLWVYTRPEERGRGLARQLLVAARETLSARRAMTALFLEVRTTNYPAIALYESLQMERIGIRKKYYSNGDDAYVYRWRIHEGRG